MPDRRHPWVRRRSKKGFNLVEVLITLTMVALLTTTLLNFVNDYTDKTRLAKARNDLMRLAQQAQLAEARSGVQIVPTTSATGSVNSSVIMTLLADLIVEMPDYDPWGNRFVVEPDGTVNSSATSGTPYVLDSGFGRFISAGPDGVVDTQLGSAESDVDNDLVVEFRQQPWVAYAADFGAGGEIWIAKADGSRAEVVTSGVANVAFTPDGSRYAAVRGDKLVFGNTSAENTAETTIPRITVPDEGSYSVTGETWPLFFPDGNHVFWIDAGGGLRVYDMFANLTQQVIPTGTFPIPDSEGWSGTLGRMRHVSRARTYYWLKRNNADQSIAIAVSPDGKIAYGNYNTGNPGIHMVLPDGSGRRRLKAPQTNRDFLPLAWLNSGSLLYYAIDAGSSDLVWGRIGQDGRFDITLFPPGQPVTSPSDPFMPSISPNGDLLAVVHNNTGDGFVVHTDGSGFLKGDAVNAVFPLGGNFNRFQEALWGIDGQRFYLAKDDNPGIREVDLRLDQPTFPPAVGSPALNNDLPMFPGAADLSDDGLLMAVMSNPAAGSTTNGVFVYPLLGPHGARLQIDDRSPTGGFAAIRWLRD